MKSFVVQSGMLIIYLVAVTALAETNSQPEKKVIPLKDIWANGMPGTRGIRELEAKLDVHDPSFSQLYERSLVRQMGVALASRRPKQGENVGPAFVVGGTGKQALENACDVITRFIEPGTTLPPETDLTLVFYSVIGGGYVHIAAVEKSDHVIAVKYRFVRHNTRDDSLHFALIPLGKLPEEKYEVKIEQIGSVDTNGRPEGPITHFEHVVCRDTSFTVRKERR